ncbi:Acyl-CoA synthetase (AMP-forming)/AMP-acid ligase II [Sulfitobacter pontiacus]|jgi:long-chain acyl-CoA synthetase|uniref:Acyl-CoA synthetase (AMP-forming)/AMP-acid ligase II n=1 Tax=Sulfitobacter pontiacus TaxID=60137 RepID=A0A1H2VYK7_9RHOB|nr:MULTISPECIES: class I adenylate-forming enzyme family protein [Sulfitobacter]QPO09639.1 acyl--CoA ligase [Sulfitobacter sp. B30-2]SDW73430.1 Acyl-CoA synthetase (AMP-forming)/AMP-acid ligase II [Sulfitobacter pontiacus]
MIPINPPAPATTPTKTIVEVVRDNAKAHPEKLALVCDGQTVSWGAFDQRINKIANLLLSMGVSKGDNIAIISPNSIPYAELFMGILRAGACVTPLSTMASPDALQKMLTDCGARAIFVAAQYLELVDGFIADLDLARFAIDFDHPAFQPYGAAVDGASDSDPEIQIEMSDAFNLIYSSGTTGTPKGILHNHWMRSAQMDRVSPNGYDDNARTLLSTPLYSNTTIVSFLPTLYGGSTVYLMPKFDARGYLEIVQREKITHTMLVPVQYKRIMDVADFDAFDLSSMQVKFSTSAPLRAEVKADVLARFPGKLLEYYGLTEGGGVTVLNSAEHPDKLHTVGQPAPGNEIRLIDETGAEVPKGTVGEICGRGPTMMAGYFGRDDLTADYIWRDAAGNVFFRSGDMGRFDEDGFLILSDRKKDMIISGGLNIYADDLELVLLADPDVTDAAVIGVPSDAWGETPYGLVVLREGATRSGEDICADANAKLGKSQRLSAVELREELPRSSIGKILKKELRAPFWAAVSA